MTFNFLPEWFAASTTQVVASVMGNLSPLLLVIMGTLLAIVAIEILVHAIRGR